MYFSGLYYIIFWEIWTSQALSETPEIKENSVQVQLSEQQQL